MDRNKFGIFFKTNGLVKFSIKKFGNTSKCKIINLIK